MAFRRCHKVVSIKRRLIDQGVNSFWAICVDYLKRSSSILQQALIARSQTC